MRPLPGSAPPPSLARQAAKLQELDDALDALAKHCGSLADQAADVGLA